MKVSELEGADLDYWVEKAEGLLLSNEWRRHQGDSILIGTGAGDLESFSPSMERSQGDTIIEREKISTVAPGVYGKVINGEWRTGWMAIIGAVDNHDGLDGDFCGWGNTPLIAAMRCYVISKFGEEVSHPKEGA